VIEGVYLELGVVLHVLLEQTAQRSGFACEFVDDFFEDADGVLVCDVRLEVCEEPCDDLFEQRLVEVLKQLLEEVAAVFVFGEMSDVCFDEVDEELLVALGFERADDALYGEGAFGVADDF